MEILSQRRFPGITVTAFSMAIMFTAKVAAGDADMPSQTVSLEPGKHKEVCLKMATGQAVGYQFTSDRPVAFNVHYHEGSAVEYPVRLDSVREASDRFVADADRGYCLMWSNRTKKKTDLTYRVDGPQELPAH